MHTLVIVFLAIIAVTSLLQAAAAVGAAIAARRLGRRIDDLEIRFERDVRPGLARISRVAGSAAEVSDRALAQAQRIDGAVARAARRVNDAVDRVALGVQGRVVESVEKVEDQLESQARRVRRPFARAAAIVEGLRRGVTVWRDRGPRPGSDAAEPPHVA